MESFSFLKYLRGGALAGTQRAPVAATTIAASACEDGGGGDVDDDASFFDLEFAVPGGDESAASDADEERVEFNFAVAGDDAALAPAAMDAGGESGDKQKNSAEAAEVAPASLLRPAARFRVLLLKLRKPPKAPVPAEGNGGAAKASRFLIKFRVDDAPLFTRDNSSRTSDAGGERPPQQVVVRAPRASVPGGLKQVCKRLGKSRSASSAVAAAPSPSPAPPGTPQRRDDSLLQVQDGIQSAIAHCKRSFNASKGDESPLLRSMTTSDPRADTTDGA